MLSEPSRLHNGFNRVLGRLCAAGWRHWICIVDTSFMDMKQGVILHNSSVDTVSMAKASCVSSQCFNSVQF